MNKFFNVIFRKKEIFLSFFLSYLGKKRVIVVIDKVKNVKVGFLCIVLIIL